MTRLPVIGRFGHDSGRTFLQTGRIQPLDYLVDDAATFRLYRCGLCDFRVRDVDRLELREVAHGIDTQR